MSESSHDVDALYDDLLSADGWSCDEDAPGQEGASIRCRRGDESVTGRGEDRNAAIREAWSQTEGGLRELLRALGWRAIEASSGNDGVTLTVSRGGTATDATGASSRFEERGATEREALGAAYRHAVRLAENQD